MARPLSAHRLLLALLVVHCGWIEPVIAQGEESLVRARFRGIADSRGNRWDINPQGAISNGTNDCFDNGALLVISGNALSFPSPMMTADGSEYVLSTRYQSLTVTRRIRLDPEVGTVRYLEIFEGGTTGQKLQATIRTSLGSAALRVLDLKDRPFAGPLGKDDGAFYSIGDNDRPGVVFLVADPKAKEKPVVQIRENRLFEVTYTLDVPAGGSVAFVHYLAQRPNATVADARALLEAYHKRGRLIDPKIPTAYDKVISNFSRSQAPEGETPTAANWLEPLEKLAERAGVTRGKADAVLIEAGSKLEGTITGNDFELETAYGRTPVAFPKVAGIMGGESVLRPLQIFLRDGEILTGRVHGAKFSMSTESGLSLELDLDRIRLLTMRTTEEDGVVPPGTSALLTTQSGDRLAFRNDGASPLEVATPWGMVRVPLADLVSLETIREPFPAHRLRLTDRSRFVAMMRGSEWSAPTLRFGVLKLVPQSLRELQSVALAPEPPNPASDGPFSEVLGDSRLTGAIDLPTVHLVAEANVTPLAVDQIALMEAAMGDDGRALFKVKLTGGQELQGRLVETVLPLRAGNRVWRVPVAHLATFRAPQTSPPEEAPKESAVRSGPLAEPAKLKLGP